MSESLISSFLVSDVSESLRSLTKNEWCEQIAQVAHQKRANKRFPQKNEQFAEKTNERISSPDSDPLSTYKWSECCGLFTK